MKKINVKLLVAFLFICQFIFSQAPQKMSYQSVIRNSSNEIVNNQLVGIRMSILQGTVEGISVYVETHTPTTNTNGLVSLEIGNGTAVFGNFSAIDWSSGPYFVKTETDPSGGVNYTLTGTNQLLSVPYALYAETAGNNTPGPVGPTGENGTAVLNGTGNPTAGIGVNGDFYINTTSNTLFGPKASGVWPTGVSLVGSAGATGTNGTNGTAVLNGTGNPTAGIGVNGDFYINTTSNTLFGPKVSGVWPTGVSLVGPAGATGPAGAPGDAGANGTGIIALKATSTSAQSIVNGATPPHALQDITFNSYSSPTIGSFNGTSYTVGVGQGGTYMIVVNLAGIPTSGVPSIFPVLFVNSDITAYGIGSGNSNIPSPHSRGELVTFVDLNAGDVVKIQAVHNINSATLNFLTDGSCKFSIIKI
jgi:hypothetical protein